MLIFLNITAKTTGRNKWRCAISRPVSVQTTFIQKYNVAITVQGEHFEEVVKHMSSEKNRR